MDKEFDTLSAEEDFAGEIEDEGLPEKEDDDDDSNASVLAISAMLAILALLI
jgi:hypothetical protein